MSNCGTLNFQLAFAFGVRTQTNDLQKIGLSVFYLVVFSVFEIKGKNVTS
jgi:hypothetical protein